MSEARKHVERGAQLLGAGSYHQALQAYESALQIDPTRVDALVGVAQVRDQQGCFSYAADGWARVLDVTPAHAEAATARAESLRRAQCHHLAVAAFDAALAMLDGPPSSALEADLARRGPPLSQADAQGAQRSRLAAPSLLVFALSGRGESLRMLGRADESLVCFDKALEIDRDHPFAVCGKAAALNTLGRYAEAIPLWRRAVATDPANRFAARGAAEAEHGSSGREREITTPNRAPLTGDRLAGHIAHQWGRALARDERHDEALIAFSRALERSPYSAEVFHDAALAHRAMERFEQAHEAWGRALEIRPDWIEAAVQRGDVMRAAQRNESALEDYDHALALDPSHVPALLGKATALNELRRWSDAVPIWRQLLAVQPDSAAAVAGLSQCDRALTGGAAPPPSEVPTMDVDPDARQRARVPYEKGRTLMQQGRYQEAQQLLKQATEIDPTWTSSWYLLGLAFAEDRQLRHAVAAFDSVLERDPDHLDAACHRADALRRNNDYAASISAYDEILERRPDEVRATAGRAEALRMLGRFEQSIEWFDRTLYYRPRHYLALCGKAAALNALRRYHEALPLWLSARRENPSAAFVKRGLAQCRVGLGESPQSDSAPKSPEAPLPPATPAPAGRRDPADLAKPSLPAPAAPTALGLPRTRLNPMRARDELDRGRARYKERNYASAAEHFEAALRFDPSFAEAALRLGMALEESKQLRKAIDAYERCLRIDPSHFHAATNVGEAYRKNERYDDAIKAYDRALAAQGRLPLRHCRPRRVHADARQARREPGVVRQGPRGRAPATRSRFRARPPH